MHAQGIEVLVIQYMWPIFIVIFSLFFVSACVWSTISLGVFSHFAFPSADEWIPILVNGVFINGLSYIFWLRALSLAKASFVAPFIFLIPIVSSILIICIFQEPFLPIYAVGMSLVIAAGALSK